MVSNKDSLVCPGKRRMQECQADAHIDTGENTKSPA